jgi:hypothetical protein
MRGSDRLMQGAWAATMAAALMSIDAPAHGADAKAQCISAYEQGQKLKQESKLFDARRQLLICTREVCPELLRTDCEQWLKEVDQTMPSVVIAAKDPKGTDITEVRVVIDGKEAAERLDGKAIQLDPGDHVLVFEHAGEKAEERKVLIREGEKHRVIHITFGAQSKGGGEPPADHGRPIPALTWVFGGLGVVALGSFAYFGLKGKSEADSYQQCKPYCSQSDIDATHTKLIVADVSLGVGVVSIAVATYLLVARPGARSSGRPSGLQLDILPTPGGAFAGVGRSF